MIREGGAASPKGSRARRSVESGRPISGSRRNIDHAGKAASVLGRVRAFDDIDERGIGHVELAADLAVEFLRNWYAVNDVVDVAVIAVHVNHAVGAACGSG